MNAAQFLRLAQKLKGSHFYVVTPDVGGLVLLMPRVLKSVAAPRDIWIRDGRNLKLEQIRELVREAGMAPAGGSTHTHFVIHHAEGLNRHDSVGALLQVIEEATRARFIFLSRKQASKAARPLASRCFVIQLPFMSRKGVLANLQALKQDAKSVDEKNLWDGTLGGSLRNLREYRDRKAILDAIDKGMDGLGDLLGDVESSAFVRTLQEHLTPEELAFVNQDLSLERKRLVAYTLLARREST